MDYRAHEREITNDFVTALNAVPGLFVSRFELEDPQAPLDATADIVIRGETTTLLIEAKRSVFPRDLANIVRHLKRYRDARAQNTPTLLVLLADAISPGAREELQAEDVGYYDASGSLYLPAPNAHIFVDRPRTKRQEKVVGSVFAGRRAEVLHALWEKRLDWRSVKELSRRIEAAPSLVSSTLQELERHGWVETRGSGPATERRLANWTGLLDAWTDYEQRRKPVATTKFYVPRLKPRDIPAAIDRALSERRIDYEITGEYAGNVYATLLSTVSLIRARIPAGKLAEPALEAIDARPVSEGWNLLAINEGVELRFRQRIDDLWIASPLQTYFDLLTAGGRGKDAAQMLREQKLQLQ